MFYRDAMNGLYSFGGVYAALVLDWTITQLGVFGIIAALGAALFSWLGGKADSLLGPKPVITFCIYVMILVCITIVGMTPNAVIRKGSNPLIDSYSAFFENDRKTPTGLHGYFRSLEIKKINLVGLATDFCVNYSAQDAAKLGYKVSVFEKMCRSIDINGSLALAKTEMRECGVELI